MPLHVNPRLAWQLVGEEAVLLDVGSGLARGLNEVGSFIWKRIERETREEICAGLVREFEVDEKTARRDLDEFVTELSASGFLEESR